MAFGSLLSRGMRQSTSMGSRYASSHPNSQLANSVTDWMQAWKNGYNMLVGNPSDEDVALQQMADRVKVLTGQGMSVQKAMATAIGEKPEFFLHQLFERGNPADIVKALTPEKHLMNVPADTSVIDTDNPQAGAVFTAPKSHNLPSEVEAMLWAANGDESKARDLYMKKFGTRPPTEFETIKASMSPQQWQDFLAKYSGEKPPTTQPSLIRKLQMERDQAVQEGRTKDAQDLQTSIDVAKKVPWFLNPGVTSGLGGSGDQPPAATSTPAPSPSMPGAGGPSPDQQNMHETIIRNAVQQAIQTKKPVSYTDIDGSHQLMDLSTAQAIQARVDAASQPPAPSGDDADNAPPPEKPPVPNTVPDNQM